MQTIELSLYTLKQILIPIAMKGLSKVVQINKAISKKIENQPHNPIFTAYLQPTNR